MWMNSNRVCVKPSHVLLLLLVLMGGLMLVAGTLSSSPWFATEIGTAPTVDQPRPRQDYPRRTTVVVAPPVTEYVKNPHVSDSWPLAPRGNYQYMSRPVGPPIQVGVLTGVDGERSQILPLFRRESPNRTGRYQYHSKTDSVNAQDVAVVYRGRNCLQELGCDEIYDGEEVSLPAFRDNAFKVSLYPNS